MKLTVAVLPGDGVGPEVTREAIRVLRTMRDLCGYDIQFRELLIGGAAMHATGRPLPEMTLDQCLQSDAVFLGAVGGPEFDSLPPDRRPEAGLLMLRQALGGYANLRPAVAHESLSSGSPLRSEVVAGTDVIIVRELLGGLYFGEPRGMERNGSASPFSAFNTMRYSSEEVERVARIAFDTARQRRRKVTSVDKANVLETSRLWREVVSGVGRGYPDVVLEHMYVDTCAMQLVMSPKRFDVILTENLFGDILSDQAAAITGSLGMLPSASIGGRVGLYEPVHGSAPDIAGRGIANPLGAIGSAALLLRYSAGLENEARDIETTIQAVLAAGHRTSDLCREGQVPVSTREMGRLIEHELAALLDRKHAYHAV
jgi:3-isopropylmalate dehydrogenase